MNQPIEFTGAPRWNVVELHGVVRQPITKDVQEKLFHDVPLQADLGFGSDEDTLTLRMSVETEVPSYLKYAVAIEGRWRHNRERELSDDEIVDILAGPRFDELAAVMNRELQHLGQKMNAPVPTLPYDGLQQLRTGGDKEQRDLEP